jgi:hypothetical protein
MSITKTNERVAWGHVGQIGCYSVLLDIIGFKTQATTSQTFPALTQSRLKIHEPCFSTRYSSACTKHNLFPIVSTVFGTGFSVQGVGSVTAQGLGSDGDRSDATRGGASL